MKGFDMVQLMDEWDGEAIRDFPSAVIEARWVQQASMFWFALPGWSRRAGLFPTP